MANTNPKKTVTKTTTKAYSKPTAMSNKQVVKKDGKTVVTYDSKKTGAFGMATYPAKVTKVYDEKGNLIRGNRRVQGSYGSYAMERIYDPKKKPAAKAPVKTPTKPTTKTVVSSKGKTVYDPKAGTKTVYDSKGKTVTNSKAGTKTVYDKKGKTETDPYGKGVSNKQGYTYVNKYGMKMAFDKKGETVTFKDGSKKVYDKQGVTSYDKNGKKITPDKILEKNNVNSGPTVSQAWVAKTGTSWSEAKKQGLTDGSAKANLALLEKLKAGAYDKKPAATVTSTPAPTPTPVVTTTTPETKMKPKGTPTGGSGIGAMERMEGMYKRGGSVKRKMKPKKK